MREQAEAPLPGPETYKGEEIDHISFLDDGVVVFLKNKQFVKVVPILSTFPRSIVITNKYERGGWMASKDSKHVS